MIFVLQLARPISMSNRNADLATCLAGTKVRLLDDSPNATAEA
jgi:hypothetical protein